MSTSDNVNGTQVGVSEKQADKKSTKWILLVDDEPDIRQSLKELIKFNFGDSVRVVEASDGMEATTKIHFQAFHCIITDLKMPRKDGENFIEALRRNPMNESTPVILLSGFATKDIESKFHFVSVVTKPFVYNELIEIIENKLRSSQGKERLSATVYNNLIAATTDFLKSAIKSEVSVGATYIKKVGEDITDMTSARVLVVQLGQIKNSFCVAADTGDLKYLSESVKSITDSDIDFIYRALGETILKCGIHKVDRSKYTDVYSVTLEGKDKEDFVRQSAGIVLPLQAGNVKIKIFATIES